MLKLPSQLYWSIIPVTSLKELFYLHDAEWCTNIFYDLAKELICGGWK
jgi:hypothetical protein